MTTPVPLLSTRQRCPAGSIRAEIVAACSGSRTPPGVRLVHLTDQTAVRADRPWLLADEGAVLEHCW
ncbi:hypothetical protein [Streptomyces sp. NPDC050388]|uniref:hypothetical protein n=1 Tax=Streptomyces sp. NPDC050388 TaxID=3155781 RepID=UPI003444681B